MVGTLKLRFRRIHGKKCLSVIILVMLVCFILFKFDIARNKFPTTKEHQIQLETNDLVKRFLEDFIKTENFTSQDKADLNFTYTVPVHNKSLEPVHNIYYIKVHKTGSSTFQNILLRYGFKNELIFAIFNCLYGMAFPNPAKSKYFVPDPVHRNVNIVAEHARFDPHIYEPYMDEKTKVIGQIRHPLKYLSSLFGFEYLYDRFQLRKDSDPIKTFLSNPEKYDYKAVWEAGSKQCYPLQKPSVTRNSMAYHFGYYNQSDYSESSIKSFLNQLDKYVSLVIITEKFDESLILLKRMFNWKFSDVFYLPIGSLAFHDRKVVSRKNNNDSDLLPLHRKWAPVDYALYDHFTNKLDNTLSKQGEDFWNEVKYLQNTVSKVKEFCKEMCNDMSKLKFVRSADGAIKFLLSKNYTVVKNDLHDDIMLTYMDCVTMVLSTAEYHHAIVSKQIPSLCLEKNPKLNNIVLNKAFCHRDQHVVYNFPWNFIKQKIFADFRTCSKFVNG